METHLVVALAFTLVLMLAAGVWCGDDQPRTIVLNSSGTEPYRETPFSAYISEVVDIDCSEKGGLSLFSVTKEDYDNCTLPVVVADDGTSIHVGDCPRVIRLVLATNIITNSINYKVGGTYYYAAYGVNYLYDVVNANPCMDGVKFKIHIEEKNEEATVSPSSTVTPTLSPTTEITDTSSVVATTTPTIMTRPTTSMTSESTESTETSRQTAATVSRPSVAGNSVLVEGVADSAVSHQPQSSLLTFLVLSVVILTSVCKLL